MAQPNRQFCASISIELHGLPLATSDQAICARQFEFLTGNSSHRNSERLIRIVCILMHLHLLAVHDYALHESVYTACAVTRIQVALSRLCLLSLRVSVEEAKGHSLCEGRKPHYAKQTDTFRCLFAWIICQDCELPMEATLLQTQRSAAMTVMVRGVRSQHICSCQIQGAWPPAHSQSSCQGG